MQNDSGMQYRRLGRTGLEVSVVGFGTNELRLLPRNQAIDTLLHSFDLGVNFVHTAPDYEGAEEIVAEAVARTDRKIIVASQGYDIQFKSQGPARHFERLFETTCARFKTHRLDLYGLAAVDDREAFRENVWGKGGMVEFMIRMKDQGRIGGIYCTNHGSPWHIRRLIESEVFDAVMISVNPLGYHLLTLHPPPTRHFEDVAENWREISPLCRLRDIGVMAMMPLAGGLLVDSLAFPPRHGRGKPDPKITATVVLRSILDDPGISCVVPGTACIAEAEENARAGHAPLEITAEDRAALELRVTRLRATVCCRCGACEEKCSQGLRVSWLFRAGEMAVQPAEAFENWRDVEYFQLHPSQEAMCVSCPNITCACSFGIDIPESLIDLHRKMLDLRDSGLIAASPDTAMRLEKRNYAAVVLMQEIPTEVSTGERRICRLLLENAGRRAWIPIGTWRQRATCLGVFINGNRVTETRPRQEVYPGGRGHFVFELLVPQLTGILKLRLVLHPRFNLKAGFDVFCGEVHVLETI
jgi:predicted aldo/keto reductase-like oxidoreductase